MKHEFKVGDRVRIGALVPSNYERAPGLGWDGQMVMLSGETCEVVRVDPHRVWVKKGTGRDWVIRADDLTLVDASEPFDLEKFKAGRDALTRDG
ncbi:MAG: hypothetical protein RBU21_02980, partial [FCB group bacterium]|nr:hypothetical protein [FCB group bacterium]